MSVVPCDAALMCVTASTEGYYVNKVAEDWKVFECMYTCTVHVHVHTKGEGEGEEEGERERGSVAELRGEEEIYM